MNLKVFYIASIVKAVLGLVISIFTYTSINVYEDTAIAIILGIIGIFILAWGVSFFLFLLGHKFFSKKTHELQVKDSYRLSLLFGIYCLINILLLIGGHRNKIRGIIILVLFIMIQIFLLEGNNAKPESK